MPDVSARVRWTPRGCHHLWYKGLQGLEAWENGIRRNTWLMDAHRQEALFVAETLEVSAAPSLSLDLALLHNGPTDLHPATRSDSLACEWSVYVCVCVCDIPCLFHLTSTGHLAIFYFLHSFFLLTSLPSYLPFSLPPSCLSS